MKREDLNILKILILVNLLTFAIVIPYVQKSVNSHSSTEPFFNVIYIVLAGFFVVFGIHNLTRKNYVAFFFYLLFASTMVFWGYQFSSLYCLGCANSG